MIDSPDAPAPVTEKLPDGMTEHGMVVTLPGRNGATHTIAHTGQPTGSRAPVCHLCGYSIYDTFIDGVRVPGHLYLVAGQPGDTGEQITADVPIPEWLRELMRLPEPRLELCFGCACEVFGTLPDLEQRGAAEHAAVHQRKLAEAYGRRPDQTLGPKAHLPHSHRMREERTRVVDWLKFQIGGAYQLGVAKRPPKPRPSDEAIALVERREAEERARLAPPAASPASAFESLVIARDAARREGKTQLADTLQAQLDAGVAAAPTSPT